MTIESAGLMYGPYVNSTLSLVTKLFMSETHEETALQANLVDGGSNSDVLPAFGRILLALVDVLGPELQSSPKVKDLFFSLYDQLKNDDDPFAVTEAIRCVQQFILFAPKLVDIESLVPFLQRKLAIDFKSQVHVMRKAAVHCLYQLSQKDAGRVLAAAVDNKLEEQLFGLLDIETDGAIQDEIKDILANFLKHVAPLYPSRWLTLCRSILAKGNSSDASGEQDNNGLKSALSDDGLASPTDEQPDEEVRGSPSKNPNATPSSNSGSPLVFVLLPRWRTQIYALTCLRMVLSITFESGIKEHFDLGLARNKVATTDEGDQPTDFLIFKLVELIRISFSTATANLYELKLEGLLFLKDILEKYSSVPDPDLDESALLEQYQAQIISALAPAFEDGNGPELVATASQVCAHYMGSGIHRDISTLARLSKLMTGLLDSYKDVQGQESLPNGKLILKISVLSSWADFYLASRHHPELVSIVYPNLPALSVHWYSTLYDYAKLTIENDVAGDLQFLVADKSMSAKNTNAYMAAVKQITLPYYQKSWISVLEALTCQLDHSKSDGINDPEQIQMFQMLLGLCVDAINTLGTVGIPQGKEFASKALELSKRNLKTMTTCLQGISKLLQMASNGTEELDKTIFTETMTVLDRLMQTEGVGIQEAILGMVQTVLDTYPSSFFIENLSVITSPDVITGSADSNINVAFDISIPIPSGSKLYKILKVVCNVFLYHIPGLSNHTATSYVRSQFSLSDSATLIGSALYFLTAITTKPAIFQKHYRDLVPFAFFIYSGRPFRMRV
jgi:hypothetical protein